MKILLTGKNGQVGWELNRSLLPLGEIIALGHQDADFSKPEELRTIVRNIRPDVIVNAAAYTVVDKAESEEELATVINGVAPGVLAEEAKRIGALLIHYSTDYVFDGTKTTPYTEDDIPNPINAYGRSKLAGERAIQSVGVDYLILRTSWVYAARGHNFLRTILRLAQERDELRIVADQIGTPTWARLIAETSAYCMSQSLKMRFNNTFSPGIYNLVSAGNTSWYSFADLIVENARKRGKSIIVSHLKSIRTNDYPTSARRPMNACLTPDVLEIKFGVVLPPWQSALKLCMESLI